MIVGSARLDEKDRKILQILTENSRTPTTKIADAVGLTEGAVRYRIKKLVESGVIRRFTIELGGEIRAIVLINTSTQIPTSEISGEIKLISGVRSVYEVSGEYSIICFIGGVDVQEVNDVVERIRQVRGVLKTVTCFVLA